MKDFKDCKLHTFVKVAHDDVFINLGSRELRSNPNLTWGQFTCDFATQAHEHAFDHYETVDAYFKRKTGEGIDVPCYANQAYGYVMDVLDELLYEAMTASKRNPDELSDYRAYIVIGWANSMR